MVATLGGQPQVITFALDTLLAQGAAISDVFVIHLSLENRRTRQSLVRLGHEFVDDLYAGKRCRLRHVPILMGGRPLLDIRDEIEAEATWQTVRNLLAELKNQGRQLHVCVSGGRRMMGLQAMSAAALLCDHHDRMWHMFTPDDFRQQAAGGAIMHYGPNDGVQLIQVPLAPWGTYFPGLRAMAQAPHAAVSAQMGWLRSGDEERCRRVIERLTQRQQEALQAFARGLRPQEVAAELQVTLGTVNAHKTAILAECRLVWEIAEQERLDYHFISQHFSHHFRGQQPV